MKRGNEIKFINDAGKPPTEGFPWEDPMVREDVLRMVSIRLPEPEYLKLKWLCEQERYSMQQYLLNAVISHIDNNIAQLASRS